MAALDPNNTATTTVKSPCIMVCDLNSDDVCTGCYRSIDEIAAWSAYSNEQKREALRRCNSRRKASGMLL